MRRWVCQRTEAPMAVAGGQLNQRSPNQRSMSERLRPEVELQI